MDIDKYLVRRIVTLFIGLLIVVGVVHLIALANDNYECDGQTVIVESGDTLWGIAQAHCTGDKRNASNDLAQRYGTSLKVGQRIELPKD
jgi:hypothetical protein